MRTRAYVKELAAALLVLYGAGCFAAEDAVLSASNDDLPFSSGSMVPPELRGGQEIEKPPADLPRYPGWVVLKGGAYMGSSRSLSFRAITQDSPTKVVSELRRQARAAGWKEKPSVVPSDLVLELEKPGRSLTFTLLDEQGVTEITVSLAPIPTEADRALAPGGYARPQPAHDEPVVIEAPAEERLPDDLPQLPGWEIERKASFGATGTWHVTASIELNQSAAVAQLERQARSLGWRGSYDAFATSVSMTYRKDDRTLDINVNPYSKGTRITMWCSKDIDTSSMRREALEWQERQWQSMDLPPEMKQQVLELLEKQRNERDPRPLQERMVEELARRRSPAPPAEFPADFPDCAGWQVALRESKYGNTWQVHATAPAQLESVAAEVTRQARADGWVLDAVLSHWSEPNEAQARGWQNDDSYRLEFKKKRALMDVEIAANGPATVVDIEERVLPAIPGDKSSLLDPEPAPGPTDLPGMPRDLPNPGLRIMRHQAFDEMGIHWAQLHVHIDPETARQKFVERATALGWRQTACPVENERGMRFEKDNLILAAALVFDREPTPLEVDLKPRSRSFGVQIEMMRYPRNPLPPKPASMQPMTAPPKDCPVYPDWTLGPGCGIGPGGDFRIVASTTDPFSKVVDTLYTRLHWADWWPQVVTFLQSKALPNLVVCRKGKHKLAMFIAPEPGQTNIWMLCFD